MGEDRTFPPGGVARSCSSPSPSRQADHRPTVIHVVW
jgi:hypothetical protein